MTSWIGADVSGNFLAVDGTTSATYLGGGAAAFADSFLGVRGYWGQVLQLLFGYTGGSIGETCVLAIAAGFVYLTVRRVIDWRIPLSYLLTAAVMALICYGDAGEILLQLLSGGLLFGAVFMATDYATSPSGDITASYTASGWGSSPCSSARSGRIPRAFRSRSSS